MKLPVILAALGIGGMLLATPIVATAQYSDPVASTPAYVPDYSHADQLLPDHTLDFDAVSNSVDVVQGTDFATFTFSFTNVSGGLVVVLNVHPSCSCTTAETPRLPWLVPAGTSGSIKLYVNLAGKQGTLFKSATFTTDKGRRDLMMRINIVPAPAGTLTDDQKMAGIIAAKADRQAVFKGDCATCHIAKAPGLFGDQLFKAVCAVCHEAQPRATMVPDLAKLKIPTNEEFWRTWITYGKAGSLMPAFSNTQGGPLSDPQIASLAAYLAVTYPSAVTNNFGN